MSVGRTDVEEIGRALAAARRNGHPTEADTDSLDAREADLAQAAANAAYGGRRIGYKIGCTSPEAQAIVGTDRPFFGIMVTTDAHSDGAAVPWSGQHRGVECEFAFRFAKGWPAGLAPDDRDGLLSVIATCHPALEVVGRRTRGAGFPRAPGIVADFAAHTAFIEGRPIENWRDHDLAEATAIGLLNGAETNRGSGTAVLGHPLNALAWLGGALAACGRRIEPGEIVTTGTMLGVVAPERGAEIVGDFGALGRVSLRFSD